MRYEEKLVTPEMAAQMLSNMVTNRIIRPQRLKRHEQNLKDGTFTLSPNPISFNSDGVLIDGQHRLTAIINTGISAKLMIAYDVPANSVIDRGAERSEGDSLYMRGLIRDPALVRKDSISLVNRYFRISRQAEFSAGRITDDEKAKFLNENSAQILDAIHISHAGSSTALARRASTHVAAFAALKCGVSTDTLTKFFKVVNTGFCDNGDIESAAVLLRNHLINPQGRTNNYTDRMIAIAEMAIRDYTRKQPRRRPYQKFCHYYIDEIEGKTCLAGISDASSKGKKSGPNADQS